MQIEYIVAAAVAVLISALIIALLGRGETFGGKKSAEHAAPLRHCPICRSELAKGEKVKSVLYPGKTDRMMEIYGCPHCYPVNRANQRICPVCSRPLPKQGIIYARYFYRPEKPHVHVLGCTSCYTRRR